MHELRGVYGCLPGGGVLQLRSPSDRQYRADAGRRCDRGAYAQRRDLVLRRVYVVPAPLSPRQYSRLCHPGAADAFPKARFLRREREGAAATGPQAHDRGEYPPYGLLCDPETGEARVASRTGHGLGVDLRERRGDLRTVFRRLQPSRCRGAAQAGRPVHGGTPPDIRRHGRQGVFRHDREAFRPQGPRDGIRRCGRRVHDGYLQKKIPTNIISV